MENKIIRLTQNTDKAATAEEAIRLLKLKAKRLFVEELSYLGYTEFDQIQAKYEKRIDGLSAVSITNRKAVLLFNSSLKARLLNRDDSISNYLAVLGNQINEHIEFVILLMTIMNDDKGYEPLTIITDDLKQQILMMVDSYLEIDHMFPIQKTVEP